jgi:uncharacterized protein (TIGR03067 family)
MKRALVCVLCVGLTAIAQDEKPQPKPRDNEATRDLRKIQGEFAMESIFHKGEPRKPKTDRLVIKDDLLSIFQGDKEVLRFRFKLDPVHDPKWIDLRREWTPEQAKLAEQAEKLKLKDAPKLDPRPLLGLYGINGDGSQFVLGYNQPGEERPEKMASGKEDDVLLLMCRRPEKK